MVLVDYCNAFDMVDHELLWEKLKIYGVENNAINWFKSYLVNRHQFVSISGVDIGVDEAWCTRRFNLWATAFYCVYQ